MQEIHFKRYPASLFFLYTFGSLLIKSVSLQVYETLENSIKKPRKTLYPKLKYIRFPHRRQFYDLRNSDLETFSSIRHL